MTRARKTLTEVQQWQKWLRNPKSNTRPPQTEARVGANMLSCIAPYLVVHISRRIDGSLSIPGRILCAPHYDKRYKTAGVSLFTEGAEDPFLFVALKRKDFSILPHAFRPEDAWHLNLAFYLAGALKTFPGPITRNFDPSATINLKYFRGPLPLAEPGEEYLDLISSSAANEKIHASCFMPQTQSFTSRLIRKGKTWRIKPSTIFPADVLHAFISRAIIGGRYKLDLSGEVPILRVSGRSRCYNTITLGEFSLSHRENRSPFYSRPPAAQWERKEVVAASAPAKPPVFGIRDWKTWLENPAKEALPPNAEIRVNDPKEVEIAPRLNVDLTGIADGVERIERVPYYDAKRGVAGIRLKNPGETKYFLEVALRRFRGRKIIPIAPSGVRFADQAIFELAAYFAGIATIPPSGFHYTLPGETLDLKHFDPSLLTTNPGEGYLESGHLKARQPLEVRICSPSTSSFPLPLVEDGNEWVINNLEAPKGGLVQLCTLTSRNAITSLTHIVEQQGDQLFLRVLGRGESFGFPSLLGVFHLSAGADQTPHYTPVTLPNWLKGKSPRPGFSTLTDVIPTNIATQPNLAMVASHSLFLPPEISTHEGLVVARPREDDVLGFGVYGFNSATARFDHFAGNTLPR